MQFNLYYDCMAANIAGIRRIEREELVLVIELNDLHICRRSRCCVVGVPINGYNGVSSVLTVRACTRYLSGFLTDPVLPLVESPDNSLFTYKGHLIKDRVVCQENRVLACCDDCHCEIYCLLQQWHQVREIINVHINCNSCCERINVGMGGLGCQ